MRYALYFSPAAGHPLTREAASWLGRDAFTGIEHPAATDEFDREELSRLTADPRRYGFHATLKAPFSLKTGQSEADLLDAFSTFCREQTCFEIPSIVVGRLGPFFALVPEQTHPPLQDFASATVRHFEPFRAALSPEDIARRNPDRLDETERKNLFDWGYPHVFEAFRFHMTLTGPVPEDSAEAMAKLLDQRFQAFIRRPLVIDGLALFIEPERGAPFLVHSWQALGPAQPNG